MDGAARRGGTTLTTEWRPRAHWRYQFMAMPFIAAVFLVAIREHPMFPIAVAFCVAEAVGALAGLLVVSRVKITLTADALVVRNIFSTYRIDLRDIAEVKPGWLGIVIRLHSGRVVYAYAVQKRTELSMLQIRTRADAVTAEILGAAAQAQAPVTPAAN
jgi:hypothetical protein